MSTQTLTLHLPDPLYARLQERAENSQAASVTTLNRTIRRCGYSHTLNSKTNTLYGDIMSSFGDGTCLQSGENC